MGKNPHGAGLAGSGRRGGAGDGSSRAGGRRRQGWVGRVKTNGSFHSTPSHITLGNAKRYYRFSEAVLPLQVPKQIGRAHV